MIYIDVRVGPTNIYNGKNVMATMGVIMFHFDITVESADEIVGPYLARVHV